MRIALIGADGQLGTALRQVLDGDVVPLGRGALDITDEESVHRVLNEVAPGCVINAAAYNFVDRAEDEPDVAGLVNTLGPRMLAQQCTDLGVPLVHISTDYVFGSDHARRFPYREEDDPGPVSLYGMTKWQGELQVTLACERYFLLRTCGLYGRRPAGGKGNFVETMLRLAGERDELRVVNDQRCTPTSASDLAQAIARLIETDAYGLYHATNSGDCTWYEFAGEIFRQAGVTCRLTPITTAEYGARARRPAYSVLDGSRLAETIGEPMPPWQDALARYLQTREGVSHAT